MDTPNHLHHVFGSPRHNLDRLVQQYGSREAAGRAIREAVEAALEIGKLALNARGVFDVTLDVGGNQAGRESVPPGSLMIGESSDGKPVFH